MDQTKVVITGSNGLLGQKLVKLLLKKRGYDLYAISRGENRMLSGEGYTYISMDLAEPEKLRECLLGIRPDFLIHTAAMTNVDACELDRETCHRLNVDLVEELVGICEEIGTHLVHISTDFIFNGKKGTVYTEEDLPEPVNYYGRTKWESEMAIIRSGLDYTILRTILVYGRVDRNDRSNIVLWVKRALEKKEHIRVVTDQWRMPTLAEDLAEACWLAIKNKAKGIYNVSSTELMSIYEIALSVADVFDLDKHYIHPVKTEALDLPAKRPERTGFDLSKSASQLGLPLHAFRERLQFFKEQLRR